MRAPAASLGSHAAKVVELRQTLRGLEVVQLRHLPFDDPTPGVGSELRQLVQLYDLPGDYVVVSLAGDRISTRRLEFPFRDRKKIAPAVPFEVEGQVPFPLDDYFVDWEIAGEQKSQTQVIATLAPRAGWRTGHPSASTSRRVSTRAPGTTRTGCGWGTGSTRCLAPASSMTRRSCWIRGG